jgi:hypothetical protein
MPLRRVVLLIGVVLLVVVAIFGARDYTKRQAAIDRLVTQQVVPRIITERKSELRTRLVWYGIAGGAIVLLTLAVAAVVPGRKP